MNNFVERYNENRKISGVGGALYFKKPSDEKYAFAFATGTIPSFVGDTNTYDAFVITEQYAGKTEGQQVLEKQDLPVMWHRDMKARAIELSNMGELDFFNEALGLADYVRTHHGYAYDHRDGAQKTEYPRDSKVLIVGDRDPVETIDVVVDCSDMNVYQVETY